jgi:hypothetical protein
MITVGPVGHAEPINNRCAGVTRLPFAISGVRPPFCFLSGKCRSAGASHPKAARQDQGLRVGGQYPGSRELGDGFAGA